MLGAIIGAAGSFLGAKSQQKAQAKMQKRMLKHLNAAAAQQRAEYQAVIDQIQADPTGYAGSRVQAAQYNNVALADSLGSTIGANRQNLSAASDLAWNTNAATLANDLTRISQFAPGALATLSNLSSSAQSLSAGQLPQDVIQQLISQRSSSSAAAGIPGGSAPATLRDLGLTSLDAVNQGASLLQSILQSAEQISPIGRQLSPAQFQVDVNTGLQTDLAQALLQQQSQQNAYNLAATPDPAKSLQAQLQIQMANNEAATRAGQTPLMQTPTIPYAQIYGQVGNALGQGLQSLLGNIFGQGSSTSQSGPYGGMGASAYNSYAQSYNSSNQNSPQKAYVVY